jgi:hypothetical protein
MNSNSFIQIRLPKLGVMPGEDEELVNEGMYGKAFAQFLESGLSRCGYQSPVVVCEDWGWWVTVAGLPFSCGLCIYGSRIGDSDELDLCVTVSTPKGRRWDWRQFRFVDTTPEVERLDQSIRAVCEADPEITVVGETPDFSLG